MYYICKSISLVQYSLRKGKKKTNVLKLTYEPVVRILVNIFPSAPFVQPRIRYNFVAQKELFCYAKGQINDFHIILYQWRLQTTHSSTT